MRISRLLLITALVAAMLGLVSWWGGRSQPPAAAVDRSDVPSGQTDGEVSSTWYCAAGSMQGTPLGHDVILLNPTGAAVTAQLRGFVATPAVGAAPQSADSSTTTAAPTTTAPTTTAPATTTTTTPPQIVTVEPRMPLIFDAVAAFGSGASITVESSSGELTVAHRLYTDTVYGDQKPCSTNSSGTWYFPVLSTARTAASRLTLFNPFPGDASVDVLTVLDNGVRVPAQLSGIVLPAGTSKVVDLGSYVQRRDQFSAEVRLRSGRAIAEVTQSSTGADGSIEGLAVQPGSPDTHNRWSFSTGFIGTGATESLIVLNPSDETTKVAVQVSPYGAGSNLPEPFLLEVPALRYTVLDLSKESRIPPDGYHSITVDSGHGNPIVVGRQLAVSAAPSAPADPNVPMRPNVTGGLSIDGGSPVAGVHWILPMLSIYSNIPGVLFIHNPGPDPAKVTATVLYDGARHDVSGVSNTEIAPGESLAVDGSSFGLTSANVGVDVSATQPVVVQRFVPFPAQNDFSVGLGVPIEGEHSQLVPIGSR